MFGIVLNVFGLCDVFESCSEMSFNVAAAVCYSVVFMFNVIVVNLIAT